MVVVVATISFRPNNFFVVNKVKKNNQSPVTSRNSDWRLSLASLTESQKLNTGNNRSKIITIDNLTSFLGGSLSEKIISSEVDLSGVEKGKEEKFATQFLEENLDIVTTLKNTKFPISLELPIIDNKEIIISKDSSSKSLLKYRVAIESLLTGNFPNVSIIKDQEINNGILSPEEIITYAILNNNFTQIDNMITYYDGILLGLKKIVVPTSVLDLHKKRVAFFSLMVNIFKAIKSFPDDPTLTIVALNKYQETGLMVSDILKEVERLK